MKGLISVNGQATGADDARISPLDRGFLLGDTVFEVLVAFGNHILDVIPHLERLRHSAELVEIPIPWSDEELTFELESLVRQLGAVKTYLRLVVSRGVGLGLKIHDDLESQKIVYCFPAALEEPRLYDEGMSLKRTVLPFTDRGAHAKTGNYLRSVVALNKAQREGWDEILWTNSSGEITESTTANVFFIGREGDDVEICTPPPYSGLLLGITRGHMIQLLERSSIKVTERIIFSEELPRFDEAFLCSTVRGLVPIRQIGQHKLHTRRANSVFRHFERLYLTWVESEIGYRVDWNSGRPVQ